MCSSTREAQRENCALPRRLMHHPFEHINKGVGWYLHEGAFTCLHADRMFVGTVENMREDLARLAAWLKLKKTPSLDLPPVRVTPRSSTHLSAVAVANIRAYYNSTPVSGVKYASGDYETMRGLVRAGLLPAHRYTLQ